MRPKEQITVVVPTYNRAKAVVRAVHALLRQSSCAPFSILVVDNNSSDHTRIEVERIVAAERGRVRYFFEPRQGVSHARNRGIHESATPLLAFTDDDVEVSESWVSSIEEAFRFEPRADFIGGRVLPIWPPGVPAWLTEEHYAPLAIMDYGSAPRLVDRENPICLGAGNFACTRKLIDSIGGFDPSYQHRRGAVSAVEDHEFCLRAVLRGYLGLYWPKLEIRCDVPSDRLTKRYHRQWRRDHGVALAALDPLYAMLEQGSSGNAGVRRAVESAVPPWLVRRLAVHGARWLIESMRGRVDGAFAEEVRLREMIGYARGRVALRRATGASPAVSASAS